MATNETEMLRNEINRLNQLIDALLAANQQLQQQVKQLSAVPSVSPIAYTHLTAGNLQTQIADTDLTAGNIETPIAGSELNTGNPDMKIAGSRVSAGNKSVPISDTQPIPGNLASYFSGSQFPPGKIEMKDSMFAITVGTYQFNLSEIKLHATKKGLPVSPFHLALRDMMKKGTQSYIYSTALILLQLHATPATSLQQLQHLTGLSYGGIAKRIMMMKRDGFIVAHTAPKRFVLTEKAAQLFAGL